MKAIRRSVWGLLVLTGFICLHQPAQAVTGGDKSNLLQYILNWNLKVTNWMGTNFGWSIDERLIDNSWTLTFPIGDTNSVSNITSYILGINTNRHLAELSNDSKGLLGDSTSEAEIHGFWFTWDTNGVYWAIQGESKGRGNNLMLLMDRVTNAGIKKFSTMDSGWKRNINLQDWDPDLYVGFWSQDNLSVMGGWQVWEPASVDPATGLDTDWQMIVEQQHATTNRVYQGGYTHLTNSIFVHYNADDETLNINKQKRVSLGFMSWKVITNSIPVSEVSNLTLRLGAVSTGPDDLNPIYDFCPDNLGGVDIDNPQTFTENYFTIRVFSNGNVVQDTRPFTEATVRVLPGSIYLSGYVPTKFGSAVDNLGNTTSYLAPDQGASITLQVPDIAQSGYIGNATVIVYDLFGRIVRILYDSPEALTDLNVDTYLNWDGTDDAGNIVSMGSYIIILQGNSPSGKPIKLKYYLNVLR